MTHKSLVKLAKTTTFANPGLAEMRPALCEIHGIAYAVEATLARLPRGLSAEQVEAIAQAETTRYLGQWLCVTL